MKAGHTYTGIVMDYCHVVLMGGDAPHVRFDMCGPEDIKFWEEMGERYCIYHVYDARTLVVEDRETAEKKYFHLPPRAYIVMDHIDHSFTVIDKLDGFEDKPHCSPTGRVSFYPPVEQTQLVKKQGHLGDFAGGLLADLFPVPQRPNEDHIPCDPEELEVEHDELPASIPRLDWTTLEQELILRGEYPQEESNHSCPHSCHLLTVVTTPSDFLGMTLDDLLKEIQRLGLASDMRSRLFLQPDEPTAADLEIAIHRYQAALHHFFHFKNGDLIKEYDALVSMNVSPMEGNLTIETFVPIFKDGKFDRARMDTINAKRRSLFSWMKAVKQ
jgi:hypothetical protein